MRRDHRQDGRRGLARPIRRVAGRGQAALHRRAAREGFPGLLRHRRHVQAGTGREHPGDGSAAAMPLDNHGRRWRRHDHDGWRRWRHMYRRRLHPDRRGHLHRWRLHRDRRRTHRRRRHPAGSPGTATQRSLSAFQGQLGPSLSRPVVAARYQLAARRRHYRPPRDRQAGDRRGHRHRRRPVPPRSDRRRLGQPDLGWPGKAEKDANGYQGDTFGWNFVDNNGDVSDNNGHGTDEAGIIGALSGKG